MAITQTSLSTKIQAALIAQMGAVADAAQLKKFSDAIALAVVTEIQTNATITGSGTVTSGAGAGGAVSINTGTVV